ncbi:MAG: hypothetical protein PVF24_09810, partial [Desulfobacterales bacterium]
MPVTPLHLGPGIALKSVASRQVSFTVFAFTQLLIDLEALLYFVRNDDHMHRHLHTFLGAAIVAGVGVAIGRPICQWLLKKWNNHLSPKQKQWLYVEPQISLKSGIAGAALGAVSHILLDSIMHGDMKPFLPFSEKNGLYQLLTLEQLDLLCVSSCILGLLILTGLYLFRKRQKTA